MLKLIDFHTHHKKKESHLLSIQNIHQLEKDNLKESPCSIGLHPWYLTKKNYQKDLEWLEENLALNNVLMLGECGLDRLKGEALDVQQKIFEQQLYLAEAYQKSVVIHCVRAFSELVESVKKVQVKVPLIIHGFNKNERLFNDLKKEGFMFSFGEAILNKKSPAHEIIQKIDPHLFFLETDAAEISIKKVYEQATFLRKSEWSDILAAVLENAKNIGIHV
jgi:TatD DNase family protein